MKLLREIAYIMVLSCIRLVVLIIL